MPKVSVIIPSYNSAKYLPEAIDSVLTQTYQDFEIIIVDDGSTDNTSSVIKDFVKVNLSFSIRYIYQNNAGPSSARNKGIKEAKGKYIAFLDADDEWLSGKLELQLNAFENSELLDNIGLVYSDRYGFNENENIRLLRKFPPFDRNYFKKNFLIKNLIATPTIMVRRKCFDDVGFFDTSLHVAEDWDMWFRIFRRYNFLHIARPLAKINTRDNSQSSIAAKNLVNELRFLEKLFSFPENKYRFLVKMKAYSHRYFCVSWAFLDSGARYKAIKCIFKSAFLYPFHFFSNRKFIGLFIRIIFGDRIFNLLKA